MKKTIQKPENWQDFESLCKKLWGEIWNCPGIKKNGRSGQSQKGVDIYGVPKGKLDYSGIQCKGKDDYTKSTLTEAEVDEEIKKALTFEPKLERFIFATSANKDSKIEEYIRKKDIESRKNQLFSIELYSWEDIADLIEENKKTFDWYVSSKMHKTNNEITVLFNDEKEEIILKPQFIKTIVTVKNTKPKPDKKESEEDIFYRRFASAKVLHNYKEIDYSIIGLNIKVYNTGSIAIENYKILFEFDNDDIELKETNIEESGILSGLKLNSFYNNTYINGKTLEYRPNANSILVPQDGRQFEVYLKLPSKQIQFYIHYKLLSKYYNYEGNLKCMVVPIFDENQITRNPGENEQERIFETIVPKKKNISNEND